LRHRNSKVGDAPVSQSGAEAAAVSAGGCVGRHVRAGVVGVRRLQLYSGSALKPGQSTLEDVRATMGTPALEWVNPDHSMQLSYPRGPSGFHSYMVYLDPAGRLQRIQNVMNLDSFYRIAQGMTEEQVLRILGPPWPAWTNYFPAWRELVWEWRFCNDSSLSSLA
jgi:hypothetical protein